MLNREVCVIRTSRGSAVEKVVNVLLEALVEERNGLSKASTRQAIKPQQKVKRAIRGRF